MFKTLSELMLLEAPSLKGVTAAANAVKAGYKDAEGRYKTGVADAKKAEDDQKAAAKKAEAEKKEVAKTGAAASDKDLKAAIDSHISDFFDKFPHEPVHDDDTDPFMSKIKTRKDMKTAFDAYRALADRINKLVDGLNKSLVSSKKATPAQVKKYQQQAHKIANQGPAGMPAALTNFVKTERGFFKRLVKVKDDFRLNDEDFKDLLALKLKQTDPERVPDAAQALNILFTYLADEFRGRARTLADIGRGMPPDNAGEGDPMSTGEQPK